MRGDSDNWVCNIEYVQVVETLVFEVVSLFDKLDTTFLEKVCIQNETVAIQLLAFMISKSTYIHFPQCK